MQHFLVVCLNPTMQRTIVLPNLHLNEVNRAGEARLDIAGKGVNATRVLRQLDRNAVHLTHAGGRNRELFLALCHDDDLRVEAVHTTSEVRTCVTLIDQHRRTTTEIIEPTEPVEAETVAAVRREYTRMVADAHTVILSGSTAPGYPDELFAEFTAQARGVGARVVADFRGKALELALANAEGLRPSIIKPNLSEFAQTFIAKRAGLVSEHTDDETLLAQTAEQMRRIEALGTRVVITRGANPTLYLSAGELRTKATLAVTPVNTIGCGDAFTAGLAAELAETEDMEAAIERGHACAAMNAALLKPGSIRP